MRLAHVIPTWEQFLARANRVLPRMDLTLEQGVMLSAVLSYVRRREMQRYDAYKVLVFRGGMSTKDFNRLWRHIRPPKQKMLVE